MKKNGYTITPFTLLSSLIITGSLVVGLQELIVEESNNKSISKVSPFYRSQISQISQNYEAPYAIKEEKDRYAWEYDAFFERVFNPNI